MKRLILAAVIVIVVGIITALWPTAKPVFLETTAGRYRVISARYVSGTNLTFAIDRPIKEWGRRRLDNVGIHLKGSRGNSPFTVGVYMHVISVLCEGQVPIEDLKQVESECIDDFGRTIRLRHWMRFPSSDDRVLLMWPYADSDLEFLHRAGSADFEVTNFCPRQLRLLRKSDHHELTRLDLSN